MSDPIIAVEGLGKRYRLRHQSKSQPTSLRETLNRGIGRLFRPWGNANEPRTHDEDFWALKDVSFDVNRGDVVGIIGRNGAGKSTLLKILSRITEPTKGRIRLRGRVASLLEVGTGFHPELTGRENIFLNGAILGMSKAEIRSKFDEIVAFSEVEKFLDTPVKHYSSGMYVRLAFAVAAHLEPEILIVDEVLAVGDADFQKKCLGKMRSLHSDGRTVLVVSHQMSMITALCSRAILLRRGQVAFAGEPSETILHYQSDGGHAGSAVFDAEAEGQTIGNDYARLHKAWVTAQDETPMSSFDLSEPIKMWVEYSLFKPAVRSSYPNFHVFDELGNPAFVTGACKPDHHTEINRTGRWVCCCTIPGGLLNTGTFTVGVAVTCMNPNVQVAFFERAAIMFQVTEDMEVTLETSRCGYAGAIPGPFRPVLEWAVAAAEPAKAGAK